MALELSTIDINQEVSTLLELEGFIPSLCFSLAAIANFDGEITLDEYVLIINATTQIAHLTDNPTLIKALVLKGILNNSSLDNTFRALEKSENTLTPAIKQDIIQAYIPLISTQLQSEQILKKFTYALGLEHHALHHFDKLIEPLYDQFNQLKAHIKQAIYGEDILSTIQSFAFRHNATQLIEQLYFYKHQQTDFNQELYNSALEQVKKETTHSITNFQQQKQLFCEQQSTTQQLSQLTQTLYEQLQQRLITIQDRADLQKQHFAEDIEHFIQYSINELELNLRQQFDTQDWTKPSVWDDFAKTSVAQGLTDKYKQLQQRYDQLFDNWHKEFNQFSNEILLTQQLILESLRQHELSQLIQPPSPRTRWLKQLDKASSLITNSLKLTGAGSVTISGIAIATGVPASLFIVGATTIGGFILSNPIGWAAIGTVTLAGLYQYFSNPESRKIKTIKSKREILEQGLIKLIGDPQTKHNEHLDYILDNFKEITEKNFFPLLKDAGLVLKMSQLQTEVMQKLIESGLREINNLPSIKFDTNTI